MPCVLSSTSSEQQRGFESCGGGAAIDVEKLTSSFSVFLCLMLIAVSLLGGILPIHAQDVTQVPYITTVAGNGTACPAGSIAGCGEGGPAAIAELNLPGAHLDPTGELYVSSPANNVIWKVDSRGHLIRVAGTGTAGYGGDGGPATSAQLNTPHGPTRDSAGNLYIVDTGNNVIRKVDTHGVISTFAGTGAACTNPTASSNPCGDGGLAINAQFHQPLGITIDIAGNMYIGDELDYRVRKILPNGIITSIVGDGTSGYGPDGSLAAGSPIGVVASAQVDSAGNIYFADFSYNVIRKIDTGGIVTTVAGLPGLSGYSPDGTLATAALLNNPHSPVLDGAGNLYFADSGNNVIRMIDAAGLLHTVVGNGTACALSTDACGDNGPASSAQLNFPVTINIDGGGNFYIADYNDNRVRKVINGPVHFDDLPVGGYGSEVMALSFNTQTTLSDVQFNLDDSYLVPIYACDPSVLSPTICRWWVHFAPTKVGPRWSSVVVTLDSTAKYSFAVGGTATAPLAAFTPGTISTVAGGGFQLSENIPATSAELAPYQAKLDDAGNTYVLDTLNHRVRVMNTQASDINILGMTIGPGNVATVIGDGTQCLSGANPCGDGGPAILAQLSYPSAMSFDRLGNLYIADTNNNRIRVVNMQPSTITVANVVIDPGNIATIAGNGSADVLLVNGPALGAPIGYPGGVAVDDFGNVYISNSHTSLIQKVDRFGTISVVVGYGGGCPAQVDSLGDGCPSEYSNVLYPYGMTIDSVGNLYFADSQNNRIRKIDTGGVIWTVAGDGTACGSSTDSCGDGGPASSAQVNYPLDVAVDNAGNLYIADTFNNRIRKVDTSGVISTVVGTGTPCAGSTLPCGDSGLASTAQLNQPQGLTLDSAGNLYVADSTNRRIRKVNVSDPPSLTFPNTPVGTTAAWENIGIENRGNAELIVSSISTSGNFNFNLCQTLPAAIHAGDSCTLGVQFAPTAAGTASGAIVLFDNALNTSSMHTISLTGTGTNTPQLQAITFANPGAQTYGVGPVALAASATSGLPVSFVVVSGPATVSGSTLTITGAGTVTVQATQPGDGVLWAPATPVSISFAVNPAMLTVTADNKSIGVGGTVPVLTASITGFVNGDTPAVLGNTAPALSLPTGPYSTGSYPITVAQGTLIPGNYDFTFMPGTLVVTDDALSLFNNYFVTGDYLASSVNLRGTGVGGVATGTIAVSGIPPMAEAIAAFLYWQTVETPGNAPSAQVSFNGYSVPGEKLGGDIPYTDNSPLGPASGVMRFYRANVLPFLPIGPDGRRDAAGPHTIKLTDAGSLGGAPVTPGATLVMVYRVMSPKEPLRAVVIYDGAFAATQGSTMYQIVRGFYDPVITDPGQPATAKLAYLWSNGGIWQTILVPSYPTTYQLGLSYDGLPQSRALSAIVFSTEVKSSDKDGLLNAWKATQGYFDAQDNSWVDLPGTTPGKKDVFVQIDYMCSVVTAAGTCDTTNGHSHLPKFDSLKMVADAFKARGINVHFDVGNNYQGPPLPYFIITADKAMGGNIIPEEACHDDISVTPNRLCAFPEQKGVLAWKTGLGFLKTWPKDPAKCTGNTPDCSPRFQHGRKDSFHYMVVAHALGLPRWNFQDGSIQSIEVSGNTATVTTKAPHELFNGAHVSIFGSVTQPALNRTYLASLPTDPANAANTFTIKVDNIQGVINKTTDPALWISVGELPSWSFKTKTLFSIEFIDGTAVIATNKPHGLSVGDHVSIAHADPTLADLEKTYAVQSVGTTVEANNVTRYFFTIPATGIANGSVDKSLNPNLSIISAQGGTVSGYADVGGADVAVTLGKWWGDGESVTTEAGTIMHELGHNLGLTHGGFYFDTPNVPTLEGNCKPNYESVMNYLFQVDLLRDESDMPVLDYSGQQLAEIDESKLGSTTYLATSPVYLGGGMGLSFAEYPKTRWYSTVPPQPDGVGDPPSAATRHCDGTPLLPAEPDKYRVDGGNHPINPPWIDNQDVNLDGTINPQLRGFDDWSNLDLRQTAATGSDFFGSGFWTPGGGYWTPGGGYWTPGGGYWTVGGGYWTPGGGYWTPGGGYWTPGGGYWTPGGGYWTPGGGYWTPGGGYWAVGGGYWTPGGGYWTPGGGYWTPGGGFWATGGGFWATGGGLSFDEINYETADSVVRQPRSVTAANAAGGAVVVTWDAPIFGDVETYYVYRKATDGTVTRVNCADPAPRPPTTCTDATPSAGATYYVSTVLVDGRISVAAKPTPPDAKQDQVIYFPALDNRAYTNVPFSITAVASSGLAITFSASGPCTAATTGITTGEVTMQQGPSCTITASQLGDNHYNPVQVSRSFAISKWWTITGFYQPVSMANGVYNSTKGGSTVPLKFNIYQGAAGVNERKDTAAVASFGYQPITCNGNALEDPVDLETSGATSLRYDSAAGQFIQNWKTPTAKGCYKVTMQTIDGSSMAAFFKVK